MKFLTLVVSLFFAAELAAELKANDLESYLNRFGSGLGDNLQYAVQDGIVAEILATPLSTSESQGRCLKLMQDLGNAPLGVAVRAVIIVSSPGEEKQAVFHCF